MTDQDPRYRIGQVAERAGVTTRTIRYYEELGLLDPSGKSPGGYRRYSEADVTRLLRVLELRNVMGFDLDRISRILTAEDRMAQLREEVERGISRKRHQEIIKEAIELNATMRQQAVDKLDVLKGYLDEVDAQRVRIREVARELGVDDDSGPAAASDSGLATSGR